MATKKKSEPKQAEPVWYVEELETGSKKFFAAAKKVNGGIVTKGGYWDTREEAEETAARLNKGGK